MARILVVSEDEQDYRVLQAAVVDQPHYLQHTASGLDGCMLACHAQPDMVIVGERTSDQDGLSVMRHLRHNLDLPSLLVMPLEHDGTQQRIAAYEAGADDTLPRPLNVAELSLRLKALLRQRQESDGDVLTVGALRLDRDARLFYVNGRQVPISPSEYGVLDLFMSSPGQTFSADVILDIVWDGCHSNVRMVIQSLRRKIEADPQHPRYLQTVPMFGYRIVAHA